MKGWLAWCGLAATVLYCGGAAWIMDGKLAELNEMPLNNVGDFLAGAFSPLAFLWLVLGFFQQGQELSASRAALLLQAEELRNSVEQQKQLVDVSKLQLTAEIDARKSEHERTILAAQPVLTMTRETAMFSSGTVISRFSLRNAGNRITRVQIEWESEAVISLAQFLPVIASDETVSFEVRASAGQIQNFFMSVRFIDGLAAPGEVRFLFRRHDHDSFPRFEVEQIFGRVIEA